MKIKHNNITLIMLFLLPIMGLGQSNLSYGIKAEGGVLHSILSSRLINYNAMNLPSPSLNAGLWLSKSIHQNFSFNVELDVQRTYRRLYERTQRDVNNNLETHKVSIVEYRTRIPVSISYHIGSRVIRPYVQLGVIPSYLFGRKSQRYYYNEGTKAHVMTEYKFKDSPSFMTYNWRNHLRLQGFMGIGMSYKDIGSLEARLTMIGYSSLTLALRLNLRHFCRAD